MLDLDDTKKVVPRARSLKKLKQPVTELLEEVQRPNE